jgi:WD40 repeat protein
VQTLREGHSDWIRKVTVNAKGTLLASSSKDETVIVWNLEKIRTSKDSSQDSIISILKEHENQIDCVKWAPLEANHVIDQSEYNRGYLNMLSL